jgi:hypothetical protein
VRHREGSLPAVLHLENLVRLAEAEGLDREDPLPSEGASTGAESANELLVATHHGSERVRACRVVLSASDLVTVPDGGPEGRGLADPDLSFFGA